MTINTLEIAGIGPIRVNRKRRTRFMNLTVKPFSGVCVTIPHGVSVRQAEKFVASRKVWITKHLLQARQMETLRLRASDRIDGIDRKQAAKYLVRRLTVLAERNGFSVRKVSVRNQKTRWGSCSADNNISLNVNLIHLPSQLMRYVILHELLHTRIKNHSRHFWTELDRLVGDARALRSRLNGYSFLLLQI